MNHFLKAIAVLIFTFSVSFAQAQDAELSKVKELIGGNWILLVKINGKLEPRLLKIKNVIQVNEKNFEVDATYGQVGGQGPIKEGSLSVVDKGYRLTFTNQSNSRFETLFTSEKNFKGSISSPQGSQDIVMFKASEEDTASPKAVIEAMQINNASAKTEPKEAASINVVIPEKISGRWKNNRTGYSQSFSVEKIVVSGTNFTANFTQWFDSSCATRSEPVTGQIKNGAVTFTFKPPCYDPITTTIDFVSSTGTYKFGNGGVVGSYEFK